MKQITLIIALIISTNIYAQDHHTRPLITTQGTSTVYTEPDEVLFTYSVQTEGDDLLDARNKNAQITAETIAFLKKKGIAPEHIQTQYLNIGIRYRDHRQREETKYYAASQSISVCLKDMDDYEEVMIGLLSMKISNLNAPVFRTTSHRSLMDEARSKAILAAQEKAQALASELGQSIGLAYHIEEVDFQQRWPQQNAYANVAGGDAMVAVDDEDGIALGQLEIKAKVSVSFHLLSEE
ncbi:MAG: SIMPL domain-containing protein [Flavobacteriales bacterium]|nr:SIMPL domain-containing protein [Flavobacteriales bacterium]